MTHGWLSLYWGVGRQGRESKLHVVLNADFSTLNYGKALHVQMKDFIILDSKLIQCYLRNNIKISEEFPFQHSYSWGASLHNKEYKIPRQSLEVIIQRYFNDTPNQERKKKSSDLLNNSRILKCNWSLFNIHRGDCCVILDSTCMYVCMYLFLTLHVFKYQSPKFILLMI